MRAFEATQLGSIEQFCKSAELGSFTLAAEALGKTPASVSRSISRLEGRLGVKLFVRNTRNIRLTDEGEIYWRQCAQALEQISAAEQVISRSQQVPHGPLRISIGSIYANYRILPLLSAFTASYPQIDLDIHVSNRVIDFIEEGYDIAIRLGSPPDSRLIAHKLEDAPVGIYATKEYLLRRGVPETIEELSKHDCIQFIVPSTGKPMPWIFKDPSLKDIEVTPLSRMRVHEDASGCITWVGSGGGLAQLYRFVADHPANKLDLVEVLQPYSGRTRQFSLLYPQNRHLSARVQAFVHFLKGAISNEGKE